MSTPYFLIAIVFSGHLTEDKKITDKKKKLKNCITENYIFVQFMLNKNEY